MRKSIGTAPSQPSNLEDIVRYARWAHLCVVPDPPATRNGVERQQLPSPLVAVCLVMGVQVVGYSELHGGRARPREIVARRHTLVAEGEVATDVVCVSPQVDRRVRRMVDGVLSLFADVSESPVVPGRNTITITVDEGEADALQRGGVRRAIPFSSFVAWVWSGGALSDFVLRELTVSFAATPGGRVQETVMQITPGETSKNLRKPPGIKKRRLLQMP